MAFKFEVVTKFGELSENAKGWKKELTLVSWNERDPKYDIREWDPEHEKMTKGVTFTAEELIQLRDILNDLEIE
jgi:hypothetical protein